LITSTWVGTSTFQLVLGTNHTSSSPKKKFSQTEKKFLELSKTFRRLVKVVQVNHINEQQSQFIMFHYC
jgi:hypothetical protein